MSPLERILHKVATLANRPAVEAPGGPVTYAEFGALLSRLAGAFIAIEAAPRVAIVLPQGHRAYAAMLATLMAGGFYAPINVAHPTARQGLILREFDPRIVVAEPESWSNLREFAPTASFLEPDGAARAATPLAQPRPAHGLAYVMFTSGSTGQPKGVAISQRALGHYVDWVIPELGLTPEDRVSQHANIGFDFSVLDIYAGLGSGACLIPIVSQADRLLPGLGIRKHRITVWASVPSVLDLIRVSRHDDPAYLGSLRIIVFGGEALMPAQIERLFEIMPALTIHNIYGPTETTVNVARRVLTRNDWRVACRTNVAIGSAVPGMRLDLVGGEDPSEGEIAISGPQLAEGYWNDPGRTAEAFRVGSDGVRRYHSGDRARIEGGELFFEGRLDRQVKFRGFRLELGEVDAALRAAGMLAVQTVLCTRPVPELVSFVETGPAPFDEVAVMKFLRGRLPDHAVPARIVVLDSLPRSANDKIDHNALVELASRNV